MVNIKPKVCNIILAAGKRAARDRAAALTQSDSLTLVNGRPVISWIVHKVMQSEGELIVLVCNKDDADLIKFVKKRWHRQKSFHLVLPDNSTSILHSLKAGVDKALRESQDISSIRIMLGDTILLNVDEFQQDAIYIADFDHDSRSWCVVSKNAHSGQLTFHDKEVSLKSPEYKALVGRYELSDMALLRESLNSALADGDTEMSALLSRYNNKNSLKLIDIGNVNWIDCGHLEGLATAKQKLVISRHFNSFEINPVLPVITKKSTDQTKLAQEMFWYENIPNELQSLVPKVLGISDSHIAMEYYGYGNLAEKFIYYDLPHNFWAYVLDRLFKLVKLFEQQFQEHQSNYESSLEAVDFDHVYQHKTLKRIDMLKAQDVFWEQVWAHEYIEINGVSYANIPTMMPQLLSQLQQLKQTAVMAIVHGDLCFNNILFDIQSGIIKLIDPRGKFGTNSNTILGDSRYDVAKIRHSYCGDYDSLVERDFILERISDNRFKFNTNKDKKDEREKLFDSLAEKYGYCGRDIRLIEGLHFLTMIPLHQESMDRQIAIWLTAIIKLNKELIEND